MPVGRCAAEPPAPALLPAAPALEVLLPEVEPLPVVVEDPVVEPAPAPVALFCAARLRTWLFAISQHWLEVLEPAAFGVVDEPPAPCATARPMDPASSAAPSNADLYMDIPFRYGGSAGLPT